MAVPQASLPLTFGDVFGLYRDVARFALRPTMAAARVPVGAGFAILFGALFVLDTSLALGIEYFTTGLAEMGHAFPDPIQTEYSFQGDLFAMVVIAPIIEEALFRGWLRGELAALRFAGIAWIAVALVFVSDLLGWAMLGSVSGIALILLAIGLFQWIATRKTETQVPGWFKTHYGKLVWGSTIAFGLMHLLNFESFTGPLDLMLVASQTIGGLLLAYTRTRLGLVAAIGQHAAFNFLFLSDVVIWG